MNLLLSLAFTVCGTKFPFQQFFADTVNELRFDAKLHSWGFGEFIPLADIHSPAKGFLVGDTLVVEVRVSGSPEMAEEEEIATSPAYTWYIKNFSKLTAGELYSDIFVSDGHRWRLVVYLEGGEQLSLYLNVPDSCRLSDGWYRDVESFSLTIVNQICPKDSMEASVTENRFDEESPGWGFGEFKSLADIHSPGEGFLVGDTLVIEVRVSVTSSSDDDDLIRSKNLLQELTDMIETSESKLPLNSQFLQQQRNTLLDYLALSLEASELANSFDKIEGICLLLLQHSPNSLEKTILKDLVSRLPTFKGIRSATKSTIENLDARRKALSGKRADVGSRLGQGRGQLSSHEAKYSVLSEEESRLRAEILCLNTQMQELLARKEAMAPDRKTINNQVSITLKEWKDVGKETEETDQAWLKAREELARANLSWKLFQQNLEMFQESGNVGNAVEINQMKEN